MGMAVAGQVGIPAFLMAIMIGNGANAGALSPIATAGIIVNGVMDDIGLGGYAFLTYMSNMIAHTVVVLSAYFLLGGWRLLRRRHEGQLVVPTEHGGASIPGEFERKHWLTIGVIGTLLAGVILFGVDVGLGAFACAIVLSLLKAGDESEAISLMPWRVIMRFPVVRKTGPWNCYYPRGKGDWPKQF